MRKNASEGGGYGLIGVGKVARRSYGKTSNFFNDGEAIRLEAGIETPKSIYLSSNRAPRPVTGVESFTVGSLYVRPVHIAGTTAGLGGAGTAPGLLEQLDAPGGGSFNIAGGS